MTTMTVTAATPQPNPPADRSECSSSSGGGQKGKGKNKNHKKGDHGSDGNGSGNHMHRSNHSGHSGHSHGSGHGNGHRHRNDHHHHPRGKQSKKDLWRGSLNVPIGSSGVVVQMIGLDSSTHTVYARVDPSCSAPKEVLSSFPIRDVVDAMVAEGWKRVAREILTSGVHVEAGETHPPAQNLLKLGAVWLLNETAYAAGDHAHAKRLGVDDADRCPEWTDMTLRVHHVPDRFFQSHEVDWGRYCRGLLLDSGTGATIGGRRAHVPATRLPDEKDGVVVYEDDHIGFAVLNKPGGVPLYSTLSNHAEDVTSMYGAALKERTGDQHHFVSMPLRVEPEAHGLVLAATRKEFCAYMTKQLGGAAKEDNGSDSNVAAGGGLRKIYHCLVCIKDPDDIDKIERLVGQVLEHQVDVKSPTPKRFFRRKPKGSNHEWAQCQMRIRSAGGERSSFRAACVSSRYSDSGDSTLAHRLWDPSSEHPAEDLGVRYVMEVKVELLNAKTRPHQIRGQLAALGVPIVGDAAYGGGTCNMRMHHHMWTRMAVQICHLEFDLPKWEEGEGDKKKVLVSSEEEKCVFHLNKTWWSDYLVDYERGFMPGAMAAVSLE